jgi:nitroreductase
MQMASLDIICSMLAFVMAPRFRKDGDALLRTRRPSLSAGALHPVSVLLMPGGGDMRLLRLDADASTVELIRFSAEKVNAWFQRCAELLPDANGSAIVLVADVARPSVAYHHFESLLWRDAGALLQNLAFASEAYGLAFCPLGLLGSEVVEAFDAGERLVAVGTAIVGRTVTPTDGN